MSLEVIFGGFENKEYPCQIFQECRKANLKVTLFTGAHDFDPKNYDETIYMDVFLNKNPSFQFIFVSDGCPQLPHFYNNITNAGFILLKHNKNLGKGAAIKTGVLHALTCPCRYIIFMDSDLSCSLDQLSTLTDSLDAGYSFVFGSRQHPNSTILCHQNMVRELSGKLFNML